MLDSQAKAPIRELRDKQSARQGSNLAMRHSNPKWSRSRSVTVQ
jgi:hypothetical protein